MARLRLSHPHKMMKVGYSYSCKNAKDGDPKGFKWIYQMASVSNSVRAEPKTCSGGRSRRIEEPGMWT